MAQLVKNPSTLKERPAMPTFTKQRQAQKDERGFTLIELMVVVLILGILMAIAIPTFISLTSTAKSNGAEANLTTAVGDSSALLSGGGPGGASGFGATDISAEAALQGLDAGVNYIAGIATPAVGAVDVKNTDATNGTRVTLLALGQDSRHYWVDFNAGVATYSISKSLATGPAGAYRSWSAVTASGVVGA